MKGIISAKVDDFYRSKIKLSPCVSNRASEIGHDCERYLVYRRIRWQDATLHDVGLQRIFEEGNIQERAVFKILAEAGVEIIEQQKPCEYREHQITGHQDGKILIDGKAYPLDIKSCSPFAFVKLPDNGMDLLKSKLPYQRKYPAQITIYMLLENHEHGLLLFKNKTTGELKEVWVELDYDYAESLLKKAESVNKHVADNTLPDRIEYDDWVCEDCKFIHICLPPVDRKSMAFLDDPELEGKLNRIAELKPLAKELGELDKEVKEKFKNMKSATVGNWMITGKEIERKGFTTENTSYWKSTIKAISKEG